VSKYHSAILVQPETPLVRQEAPQVPADTPNVRQEVPDNLQETPDDPQEDVNDLQGNSKVRQVDPKMTEYSWRDLSFDEEANTHLLQHFCRRGTSEKDPRKPGKTDLFQLLLKYMVASGELLINRIEDGVPILSRGKAQAHAHVTATTSCLVANVTATASTQDTNLTLGSQSQTQQSHGQTLSQLPHAEARLAKMAYKKATRIAQERTQEAAQEVARMKQEATADSKKTKKAERYRATMEKLEKLPPCPKLCRGEECSGIPREEKEPGFPYSHIDDMVVCQDKAHVSMATRDVCFLFYLWPARKRSPKPPPPAAPPAGSPAGPPAKNLGGGTSGARHAPLNNRGNNQKTKKPCHAGKGNRTQRKQQQQQEPRGQQQQQQQRNLNHWRVIEKLNLELDVARTNARINVGTSYANVVKGSHPFTTPPPPPAKPPQPQPQSCSEDDLERRQAFETLFTLYDSQHLQMMRIKDLLRK
jgi:hypothetical protein